MLGHAPRGPGYVIGHVEEMLKIGDEHASPTIPSADQDGRHTAHRAQSHIAVAVVRSQLWVIEVYFDVAEAAQIGCAGLREDADAPGADQQPDDDEDDAPLVLLP